MVKINGEEKDIAGINLAQYLRGEGYDKNRVVVEINLNIIPKDKLDGVILQENDTVEILQFVGGG